MASLKINIGVVTSSVQRGLKRVRSMFASAGRSIKNFAVSGLGMLGIGVGITGIIAGVKNLISRLDQIGKMSRNLGLTTKELQQMEFAMIRSGGAAADVTTGMRRMTRQINDLKRGLSTAVKVFDELGVTQDDIEGKSTHEQFKIMSAALSGVKDASQKAAIAQELFGRGGVKLIEMAANYEKLSAEAERLGIIIEEKDVKAAEKFDDEMENLSRQMTKAVVDSGFIPWLTGVAEGFSAVAKEAKRVNKELQAKKRKGDISGYFKTSPEIEASKWFRSQKTKEVFSSPALSKEEIKAAIEKNAKLKESIEKRERIKKKYADAAEAKQGAVKELKVAATTNRLTNIQTVGGNLASVARVSKPEMLMKTQIDIQKSIQVTVAQLSNRIKTSPSGRNLAR